MTVVTRFAPSPTGFLHIGGARTALFNWLYARHNKGKFLLRIEDTDRERSTDAAIDAILEGMKWLGLDWDEEPVFQFSRRERHAEIARQLLDEGKAYYCYASKEELAEMREIARAESRPPVYDGRWRDRDPSEAPSGVDPVVRFKSPNEGVTIVHDQVQGDVTFANEQLDDMILLRADGTPTYMLSVVVDDHDMGVTDIIRGDDHLTNAARQKQLIEAIGWPVPNHSHIPLIHGPDGAKLSKRHGALGVEAYRDMGYLPEALRNYLLRLGWSHGDDEVISTEQAIEWFNLENIGKSAARFDFAKLENLNGNYIRQADDGYLTSLVAPILAKNTGHEISSNHLKLIEKAMNGLKERAKSVNSLAESSLFLIAERPLELDKKAESLITEEARAVLMRLADRLETLDQWNGDTVEAAVRAAAEAEDLKLGKIAQPLRAALTGTTVSPGIFDVLVVLGREQSIGRIRDVVSE
ncbi:glutamate--tRNA ligase [Sneathiella sp. HT1-7]|jgi:glutamyl-tRNA synthetase|uniref:glutamate--tRNA ligase n=1 Tax=Sneathiella sp. HT1-7 TaxID=2887192 RepID=UPI001D13AE0D|nr:glutamate--tRNA ligase [Sneathiella sp. HT1-7]MCC3306096.1 glutamate--tRNA ligase [Sneathiella sp. HT1-7]